MGCGATRPFTSWLTGALGSGRFPTIEGKTPCVIPEPHLRGITLDQLRRLFLYAQTLCRADNWTKMGLDQLRRERSLARSGSCGSCDSESPDPPGGAAAGQRGFRPGRGPWPRAADGHHTHRGPEGPARRRRAHRAERHADRHNRSPLGPQQQPERGRGRAPARGAHGRLLQGAPPRGGPAALRRAAGRQAHSWPASHPAQDRAQRVAACGERACMGGHTRRRAGHHTRSHRTAQATPRRSRRSEAHPDRERPQALTGRGTGRGT
mmetsp:Transcript_97888/g.277443  ORF Transcript_97888/g.277443 Transcript_97888/m.277443 type:complete len:265 (-) Transcript_97888:533-1327(-)